MRKRISFLFALSLLLLALIYCESGYNCDKIDEREKQLTIEIPNGISLDIDDVSSSLFIGDMELKRLDIDGVSGDVNIGAVKVEKLDIDIVSGGFFASEINAEKFEADMVSGDIEIKKISAENILVDTVSGRTELNIESADDISVTSVSGRVMFGILSDDGLKVRFSTVSGTLHTGMEYTKNGKTYTFGDAGIYADIDTVSGNLYIDREN
ncbi:MAG: DUF4097 family beta strand repeat-containing protein [Eubacteriales bacterium]